MSKQNKKIKVTYNQNGKPIKYEREFYTRLFRTPVRFIAEYIDGSWNSNMILDTRDKDEIWVSLTMRESEDDGYFQTNEIREILDEGYRFNRDLLGMDHLEVSVEWVDDGTDISVEDE